jgi:uncharacterized SAM-binding protein YcdF (DUF218 family)
MVPTLRGCLLLVLGVGVLVFVAFREVSPFLAVNDPAPGGVLVVEGWVSDNTLEVAIAEFKRNHYVKLLVTGIPLERGGPLSEFRNLAYLGAATLVKLGMSTNDVAAVPTSLTRCDRTYAMASNVAAWLREHQISQGKVNLISEGPHARRSRLLFEKALGRNYTVGVMALPVTSYDERHWWRSSQGVRTVLDETIAYAYARLLFRPPKDSGAKE